MKESLKALYQKVILEHNKTPKFFYENEKADQVLDAYNPVCGDRFRIYLKMNGDKIKEVSFKGYGCAISKASCSIMVENIVGKTITEITQMHMEFMQIVKPNEGDEPPSNSVFEVFAAAKDFPGRLECVTLGWEEVIRFVKKNED